jgi:hypothetical protein
MQLHNTAILDLEYVPRNSYDQVQMLHCCWPSVLLSPALCILMERIACKPCPVFIDGAHGMQTVNNMPCCFAPQAMIMHALRKEVKHVSGQLDQLNRQHRTHLEEVDRRHHAQLDGISSQLRQLSQLVIGAQAAPPGRLATPAQPLTMAPTASPQRMSAATLSPDNLISPGMHCFLLSIMYVRADDSSAEYPENLSALFWHQALWLLQNGCQLLQRWQITAGLRISGQHLGQQCRHCRLQWTCAIYSGVPQQPALVQHTLPLCGGSCCPHLQVPSWIPAGLWS